MAKAAVRMALVLASLAAAGAAPSDDAAALAADDECAAGSEPSCALSAAQLRAHRLAVPAARQDRDAEADIRNEFNKFRQNFGRTYSGQEEDLRFHKFKETLQEIHRMNVENGEPVFGVTYSADFFEQERPARGLIMKNLREFNLRSVRDVTGLGAVPGNMTGLPPALNWRMTKVVTPVKNQGLCGACWAFSAAEEVESMYILWGSGVEGYPETFSSQQLASCTPDSSGCGGGNPISAYVYLMNGTVGLTQESFWPFEGGFTPLDACDEKHCTKPCETHDFNVAKRYQHIIGPYATLKDAVFATPHCDTDSSTTRNGSLVQGLCKDQDLDMLARSLVMFGPISIAVNAKKWFNYKSGVLTQAGCGGFGFDDLDHAVQLVGYNTTAKVPYWIVRNQWSTLWGQNGFIYLEFGANTCGLANMATFPILHGMPSPLDSNALLQTAERSSGSRYAKYLAQATGGSYGEEG